MKRIRKDANQVANATVRSIVGYPRTEETMQGIQVDPGTDSASIMAWIDKAWQPGEIELLESTQSAGQHRRNGKAAIVKNIDLTPLGGP